MKERWDDMDKAHDGGDGLRINLDRLHTTALGLKRIRRNLGLGTDIADGDIACWCRRKIEEPGSRLFRRGKNWYVYASDCTMTIHAGSLTIITAHPNKRGTE